MRHGTQCLFANLEVATGKVLAPSVGPTRTEADFAAHIEQTLETDPQTGWIFVVDPLIAVFSPVCIHNAGTTRGRLRP